MTHNPNYAGAVLTSRNTPARPSFKPESNKAVVLPILQSVTAKRAEILGGLLPFSTEPGAQMV